MPLILVVEDRPVDRKLLSTMLRTEGYEVAEASDGFEALAIVERRPPALVITDILMPTMDGYEFVRRLRELPAGAAIPVVFYSATYHEREARTLAAQCGVVDILLKPSPSRTILETLNRALSMKHRVYPGVPDRAVFDKDHFDAVNTALQSRVDQIEELRQRMAEVLRIARDLSMRDTPAAVLSGLCEEARRVTLAQQAVVRLLSDSGDVLPARFTSGFEPSDAHKLETPSLNGPILKAVIRDRRPVRSTNPQGRPESLGLPQSHPRVFTSLMVPLASEHRTYGWMSLKNKLGEAEFTQTDELAAASLAEHAGAAYERALSHAELQSRLRDMEGALRLPIQGVDIVRHEERLHLSRALHDRLGQAMTGVKLDLSWLAEQLGRSSNAGTASLASRITGIIAEVDDMLATIREVATSLREEGSEHGLYRAIRQHVREFEDRSGIKCRLIGLAGTANVDAQRAGWILAVLQEALTNVARHARATRVTVTVRQGRRVLTVSVNDNGVGISPAAVGSLESLGLVGMRERAALLAGELDVNGGRDRGTTVRLRVPFNLSQAGR